MLVARNAKRTTLLSLLAVTAAVAGLMGGAPFAAGQSAGSPAGSAQAANAQAASTQRVSAWSPSMTIGGPNFNDRTIRMVAHSTVAGSSLRIHVSNLRSTIPLDVGAVSIAAQADRAT